MRKAQVFLTEEQHAALKSAARRTGRKQSELIRRGVDLALEEAAKPAPDWKQAWENAFGIWADRTDIDEMIAERRKRSAEKMDMLEKQWRGE